MDGETWTLARKSATLDALLLDMRPFAYKVGSSWRGVDVDLLTEFAASLSTPDAKCEVRFVTSSTPSWCVRKGRDQRANPIDQKRLGYASVDVVAGGYVQDTSPKDTSLKSMETTAPYIVGEPVMCARIMKSSPSTADDEMAEVEPGMVTAVATLPGFDGWIEEVTMTTRRPHGSHPMRT